MPEQATEARTILYDQDGAVATITLNRPERLNAWTHQFGMELLEALQKAGEDESVRCVLITGAGRGFSAGADLKDQGEHVPQDGEILDLGAHLRDLYNPIIATVREMPKPVVAAVNGPAVGIGCSLAIACDMILAAESASLGIVFARVGLVPDGGSTLFAPAAVGKARAFELAYMAEPIPAAQAAEWGLVNRVVPDGQLLQEAQALASRLAKGATKALAAAKKALNAAIYPHLADQLALEADLQTELGQTSDFLEGVMAFMGKRDPEFSGR
jgi:2-(1,2-epoxy-1,2-dihydrophenyl)acetyl-CoA isomerase